MVSEGVFVSDGDSVNDPRDEEFDTDMVLVEVKVLLSHVRLLLRSLVTLSETVLVSVLSELNVRAEIVSLSRKDRVSDKSSVPESVNVEDEVGPDSLTHRGERVMEWFVICAVMVMVALSEREGSCCEGVTSTDGVTRTDIVSDTLLDGVEVFTRATVGLGKLRRNRKRSARWWMWQPLNASTRVFMFLFFSPPF